VKYTIPYKYNGYGASLQQVENIKEKMDMK